jgi:catalase
MPSTLVADILDAFAKLDGGIHPGFRPVHAKGFMYSGTFTPSPGAAKLTRAPHANRPATPVTVRFSGTAGVPTGSAVIASRPGSAVPPPIVAFLEAHPGAKAFVETPKPIPTSYARQAYFAITAFKFINGAGESRFGRFRIRPEAGTEFLTPEQVQKKTSDFLAAEMSARLARGPVVFRVLVQLAEPGDNVTDSTSIWPETRTEAEFGALTIKERLDELTPERRKMIFDPLPRVDGIDSAGDPITALRSGRPSPCSRMRNANNGRGSGSTWQTSWCSRDRLRV